MKVYFIRHAETEYNFKGLHQPAEARLSFCGEKQARMLAKKFNCLPVSVILTSPQSRARQTAEIISREIGKKAVALYFLGENRKPSKIIGKSKKGRLSEKFKKLFYQNARDSKWYYADEENFSDLVSRAKRAVKYISGRKEKSLLVVTHSNFLKLMVTVMMLGDNVTVDVFRGFVKFFKTNNTGITLCERRKSGSWKLETWNDFTHLRKTNTNACRRKLRGQASGKNKIPSRLHNPAGLSLASSQASVAKALFRKPQEISNRTYPAVLSMA